MDVSHTFGKVFLAPYKVWAPVWSDHIVYHRPTTIFGAVHCVRVMLSPAKMEAAAQPNLHILDILYKRLDDQTFVGEYIGIKSMPALGTPRHVIEVHDVDMEGKLNDISQEVPAGTWKGFTVADDGPTFVRPWIFPLLILVPPVTLQEGGRYIFQVNYRYQHVFNIPNNIQFKMGAGGLSLEIIKQLP